MNPIEHFLESKLQQRKDQFSYRSLSQTHPLVDFCSNDYLGFARSETLKKSIHILLEKYPDYQNGSGGSRLLSGNTAFVEKTEQYVADFHQAEAGLIFNSGYDANVGLLSSLPQRGDTIISDELIHASLIDGCRLSHATRYKFKHNQLTDLEEKLKAAKGNIFVVVESVYSMDGDQADLRKISKLCIQYGANLIVDEAHATGVFGKQGAGLVCVCGLENAVFARVVTFGKALGVHGAIVLGSQNLRNYLVNFARSFIYSTAAPLHSIAAIKCAYLQLEQQDVTGIQDKILVFRKAVEIHSIQALESNSPIQGIVFSNATAAKQAASFLHEKGFDVRAIVSPTVAEGQERLRICLHTYNTDAEIELLCQYLKDIQQNG